MNQREYPPLWIVQTIEGDLIRRKQIERTQIVAVLSMWRISIA